MRPSPVGAERGWRRGGGGGGGGGDGDGDAGSGGASGNGASGRRRHESLRFGPVGARQTQVGRPRALIGRRFRGQMPERVTDGPRRFSLVLALLLLRRQRRRLLLYRRLLLGWHVRPTATAEAAAVGRPARHDSDQPLQLPC